MYDGYNKMFWGALITSFNINLGPINILPNFIGFILIVSGLNTLYGRSSFERYKNVSNMGMLVALLSFIGGVIRWFRFEMTNYSFLNIVWTIAFITIEFVFFFKVLETSIEYLKENNYDELKEIYILKLRTYTIFTLVIILSLGISLILNLGIYQAIIVVLAFVLKIYLITIIYGLRNIFREKEDNLEYRIEEY